MKNQYSIIFKAFPLPGLLLFPRAPDFKIADVNAAYLKVTGKKEADLLGKSIFEVFQDTPEDLTRAPILHQSLLTVMNTGKPHTMATRQYTVPIEDTHKFTTRYWDAENTPVIDNEGKVAGIIHSVTDVTEKKLQQEKQQLLASEYKKTGEGNSVKTKLLDTIGQAIIATNLDGIINFWNKAAAEIYGWTMEEAIGKNIVSLIPVRQTKEQANEILTHLLQGNFWSGEFMIQKKKGQNFPVYATCSPIYDQNHKLSGIIAVSSQITVHKEAKAQIKISEQRYRTLFEQNLAGFYQSTVNGVLLNCNDAFVKMLKYDSQKELLGINTNELYFSSAERNDFISNIIKAEKII